MILSTTVQRRLAAAAAAPLLLALAAPVVGAMRCGSDLVAEGDSVLKLLDACGEPTFGDPALYLGTAEWTYNFGPNEFMMKVLIRDGQVERIEELGRGITPPVLEDAEVERGL